MDCLIEQLFEQGIAHDTQLVFPSRHLINHHDRQRILQALRERFSPEVALCNQLPPEDSDALRSAFYNVQDNWFHQLLESEGYDANVCAITFSRWLKGEHNTIVLCGGRLSNAKVLYNTLASCFPFAISDVGINRHENMAEASAHASLYCLPFVEERPNAITLHLMEGNAITCCLRGNAVHVRAVPMLIHCSDLSLANSFTARNTTVLFLTGDHSNTPICHNPRKELREFIQHANGHYCHMILHCKRENKLCTPCIRCVSEQ